MIDEVFIEGWVERLRREVPGAVAIVLKGSHVRAAAGPWSDIDFDVLVSDVEIAQPYLTWIEPDEAGRLAHVSVAVDSVEDWLAGTREVAAWSFGFPAFEATRLLWLGRPSLLAELDCPGRSHPGGEPELEDFIEELGKARNARLRGDDIALRLAVQEIAQLCPTLLVPLNAQAQPATRPEALNAALHLAVAPDGYRDDMLLCLGLSGQGSTIDGALAAGTRLVTGTLALLEANADLLCPDLAPHWPDLLTSGLLRRYLEQDDGVSRRNGGEP